MIYAAILFGIFLAMILILIVTLGEELWLNLEAWLINTGRQQDQ